MMKLIRFSRADERPSFGVVVADRAVALAVLQERSGILSPPLSDSHAYLAGLPETEQAARQLLAWGEAHLDKLGADERPQLAKDMDKGNQLGPYLVTADEVGDPYALQVVVQVDGQERYQGSTVEIDHKAEDVFAWLGFISSIQPGTVVGMGTIPDCTGLDHDDFLDPGAEIEIGFERLGSLRCRFAEPAHPLLPSRWPLRPALHKFHGR